MTFLTSTTLMHNQPGQDRSLTTSYWLYRSCTSLTSSTSLLMAPNNMQVMRSQSATLAACQMLFTLDSRACNKAGSSPAAALAAQLKQHCPTASTASLQQFIRSLIRMSAGLEVSWHSTGKAATHTACHVSACCTCQLSVLWCHAAAGPVSVLALPVCSVQQSLPMLQALRRVVRSMQ